MRQLNRKASRHPIRVGASALLLVLAGTGCASKPRIGNGWLAPPRLRCEHLRDAPPDGKDAASSTVSYNRECQEYLENYLQSAPAFTCAPRHKASDCRAELVTANGSYFTVTNLRDWFDDERGARGDAASVAPCAERGTPTAEGDECRPYKIGVALAGGGTKAASYAMGILAGLHDESNDGLAEQVDAISSVSGGTYAAVWYFSRLLDYYQIASEHQGGICYPFSESFADCVPRSYRGLLAADSVEVCPDNAAGYPWKQGQGTLDAAAPAVCDDPDGARFQNQLRGFPDVFSKIFEPPAKSNDGNGDAAGSRVLTELFWTVPILPAHWLANALFDWRVNLSYTGHRYFSGIARTYGYRPFDCKLARDYAKLGSEGAGTWSSVCAGSGGRPASNTEAARGHTMSALANLYYRQHDLRHSFRGASTASHAGCADGSAAVLPRIPFWIANTTAGVERHMWDFGQSSRADLEDSVFEFTPYSFGSRHYGRWVGTPSNAELNKVAGASAAFLDAQQRILGGTYNAVGSFLMKGLAENWGISIPNPRWRDEVRYLHYALPYPFYLFQGYKQDRNGDWIHLADGGMSEDLGAWSLIRRGATTMLIADESYDPHGRFEDICNLREEFQDRGMSLFVPDLQDLDRVCAMRGGCKTGYDLWAWPAQTKFLRGCVTSDKDDTPCVRRDPSVKYFTKLLIFKPAIDEKTLDGYVTKCPVEGLRSDSATPGAVACRDALEALREQPGYREFPAEVFGFLVNHPRGKAGWFAGPFPQTSTVAMTLDSSGALYGAYRELAKWQMRGVIDEIRKPEHDTPHPTIPLADG